MSWVYRQSTGELSRMGKVVATGYSGLGVNKNNPSAEAAKGLGPIPRGLWRIGPMEEDHPNIGPHVMALMPVRHDAHGRTAFFIHGDSVRKPGTASHGCIILDRKTRLTIAQSGDTELVVVA